MNRLIDAGDLPHFRQVMRNGVHGPLESVHSMRSAAAWTSMFTGCNPGKHGIYEFYEFQPETYSIKFINGGHRKVPALWKHLDEDGQSTGLINIPMTYPSEPLEHGYAIAGLDGPGKESTGFDYPADFISHLESEMGRDYMVEPGLTSAIARGNPSEAVDLLMDELQSKTQALNVLLEKKPVDCLIFVYRSLDAAQHCFWKWMDPSHPEYANISQSEIAKFGRVIDDVYRRVDEGLGLILKKMTDDDTLLILSDHGFGCKCPASSQLNSWLAAHGYLTYRKRNVSSSGLASKAIKFVTSHTGRQTKERLARLLPGLRNWVQSQAHFSGVDWSETRAYSIGDFPRLRLNIKGREGNGVVDPDDAPALLADLRESISRMRDSESGDSIVRDIFLGSEIYQGNHTAPGEDILIRWREDMIIHGLAMPADAPPIEDDQPLMPGEDPKLISGDHHIHGIFLGMGEPFLKDSSVEGLHLMDMAPTILHLRGLEIPAVMDGRTMTAAMDPNWLAQHPVRIDDADHGSSGITGDGSSDAPEYTADEQEIIEQRLRDLGYIK